MAVFTFEELRSYQHITGGESHAAWCSRRMFCTGECTDTTTVMACDGRQVTVTVTLKHLAMWPTLTYSIDGQPWQLDPAQLTVTGFQALNRRVRQWNCSYAIPDPSRRPTPRKQVA